MKYTALLAALLLGVRAFALTIPSDGSDGNFNPGSDIEVDLGQAVTGTWSDNNSLNAGQGIYDPTKWAVVFKYSSVNIPVGVTVTFKNNASRAPVIWLVSGNVTIDGTVSVAGKAAITDVIGRLVPGEPGPGGFRGGADGPAGSGVGYGPGGALGSHHVFGSFAQYALSYGNPQILPLIGGSGAATVAGGNAPGGGGAILIAAAGDIQLNGLIDANGKGRLDHPDFASGGAVRLIAEQVIGTGEVRAVSSEPSVSGAIGRIRIETSVLSAFLQITPNTVAVTPPTTPVIFPGTNAPTARVVSVSGVNTPADPNAPLVSSADVTIEQNGNVNVFIETTNFPQSGNVKLRVTSKYGGAVFVDAVHVGGSFAVSTWQAVLTFSPGFSTLQAIATVP